MVRSFTPTVMPARVEYSKSQILELVAEDDRGLGAGQAVGLADKATDDLLAHLAVVDLKRHFRGHDLTDDDAPRSGGNQLSVDANLDPGVHFHVSGVEGADDLVGIGEDHAFAALSKGRSTVRK
jgi:hypothetical protein